MLHVGAGAAGALLVGLGAALVGSWVSAYVTPEQPARAPTPATATRAHEVTPQRPGDGAHRYSSVRWPTPRTMSHDATRAARATTTAMSGARRPSSQRRDGGLGGAVAGLRHGDVEGAEGLGGAAVGRARRQLDRVVPATAVVERAHLDVGVDVVGPESWRVALIVEGGQRRVDGLAVGVPRLLVGGPRTPADQGEALVGAGVVGRGRHVGEGDGPLVAAVGDVARRAADAGDHRRRHEERDEEQRDGSRQGRVEVAVRALGEPDGKCARGR